jgi:bifunctional DNA-binding transcriptional regulator/antitoxin component of YhaV-PrlF toxin-antitoxin module
MEETVVLRPRRQITLSRQACEALGVKPGDRLALEIAEGALVIRPSSAAALDALEEFRRAIEESGVSEEEMLKSARQIRDQQFRETYPELARKHGL